MLGFEIGQRESGAPTAPHVSGAFGDLYGFKNLTHSMRIPNMCLALKLDNGKVVSSPIKELSGASHDA